MLFLIFFNFLLLKRALFGFLLGWYCFDFYDWGILDPLRCCIINRDVFLKAFPWEFG